MSDDAPTPDAAIDEADVTPADKQVTRLWLALIDGCAENVTTAWAISHAIQTCYREDAAAYAEQRYREGVEEGRRAVIAAVVNPAAVAEGVLDEMTRVLLTDPPKLLQ